MAIRSFRLTGGMLDLFIAGEPQVVEGLPSDARLIAWSLVDCTDSSPWETTLVDVKFEHPSFLEISQVSAADTIKRSQLPAAET